MLSKKNQYIIGLMALVFLNPMSAQEAQKNQEQATSEGSEVGQNSESGRELGMSIIGNQELPKVLYIVPWKSPQKTTEMPVVSRVIDEVFEPIEPEVFERKINYHQQLKPAGDK